MKDLSTAKSYHPGRCNHALSWKILVLSEVSDAINHDDDRLLNVLHAASFKRMLKGNNVFLQLVSIHFPYSNSCTMMNDRIFAHSWKEANISGVDCRISALSANLNSASELCLLSWHEPKGIVVFMRFNLVSTFNKWWQNYPCIPS